MKLWLLRPRLNPEGRDGPVPCLGRIPPDPWDGSAYDKQWGMVVRAEIEDKARAIAQRSAGDEAADFPNGTGPWTDGRFTTCVELIADGEPGVILRDFLSG